MVCFFFAVIFAGVLLRSGVFLWRINGVSGVFLARLTCARLPFGRERRVADHDDIFFLDLFREDLGVGVIGAIGADSDLNEFLTAHHIHHAASTWSVRGFRVVMVFLFVMWGPGQE